MPDRYLRIVLTVIAVELAWLGVKDLAPTSASAQSARAAAPAGAATPAATRVVITGVDLPTRTQFLPVAIAGSVRNVASPPWAAPDVLRVEAGERPLRVDPGDRALRVEASERGFRVERIDQPIHVDTSQQPLDVRGVVQATTRPGI